VHSVPLCQDSRHLFVCIPEADDLIRFDNLSHPFVCITVGEDQTRLDNVFYPYVCISVAENVTRLDTYLVHLSLLLLQKTCKCFKTCPFVCITTK
jgi:hypothetical protein